MPVEVSAAHALAGLLARLHALDYRFTTVTPLTHARVLRRREGHLARDLRDVLGWSLPFVPGSIDAEIEALLDTARLVERRDGVARSLIRVSRLDGQLFVHSAYPTDDEHAVFFGPDSYRFARLIRDHLAQHPPRPGAHIVDIGTGSGVGGVVAGRARRDAWLTLTDVNPAALALARVNARAAGVTAEFIESASLDAVDDPIDLAIANPPYVIDPGRRAYRDGGDLFGGRVALDMVGMAAGRLSPGGTILLYTGAAIVDGRNPVCEALGALAQAHDLAFDCGELDPDVFGEELDGPAYTAVERIAVIAATLTRGSQQPSTSANERPKG